MAIKIKPIFEWRDLWIGVYYDKPKRRWYVLPVPCFGITIDHVYDRCDHGPADQEDTDS